MTKTKHKFLIFHYRNPKLWQWIDHYALERARGGREHYSIQTIIELARWHTAIPTERDIFKVRDAFTPHYARMWMLKHPEYNGFFKTRPIPDDSEPDCDDYSFPKEPEGITE